MSDLKRFSPKEVAKQVNTNEAPKVKKFSKKKYIEKYDSNGVKHLVLNPNFNFPHNA